MGTAVAYGLPLAVFLATLGLVRPAAAAGLEPPPKPLPTIDTRLRYPPLVRPPDRIASEDQQRALDDLRRRYPNLRIWWGRVTKAPRGLYTLDGFLTPESDAEPLEILTSFLSTHRAVFRLSSDDLRTISSVRNARSRGSPRIRARLRGPRHHQALAQRWQGREVHPAGIRASVGARGQLLGLAGELVPDLARAVNAVEPRLRPEEALERAAASLGVPFSTSAHRRLRVEGGPERRQTLAGGTAFNADVPLRLIYFVSAPGVVRLAWEVVGGPAAQPYRYRLFVDAETGEIMRRTTITLTENPRWRVYGRALAAQPADPLEILPLDSPAPWTPGPDAPDGQQAPRTASELIQTNGDPAASPAGWITDDTTRGPNAIVLGLGATASWQDVGGVPTRTFDFAADLDLDPSQGFNPLAAATNAFFMTNWYHDRLEQLGFDEAAGNFEGDDPILLRRGGSWSNITLAPDGSSPTVTLLISDGPTPGRDAAFSQLVLFHELSHGLVDRVASAVPYDLHEGYADWYAGALVAEPGDDLNGTYAAGWMALELVPGFQDNYYYGFRRFPYSADLAKSPLTYADIDSAQFDAGAVPMSPVPAYQGAGNPEAVHNRGEVWASALLEVTASLMNDLGFDGVETALQLVTDSLFLLWEPNWIQARDAVLLAEHDATLGAHACRIWSGFAKRGLGRAAQPIPVVEDFDSPCGPPLDLALVLDFSGSMEWPGDCDAPPADAKVDVLKQAVAALLHAWEPFAMEDDRLGITYFSDFPQPQAAPLLQPLIATLDAAVADVQARTAGGLTALGPALLSSALAFDPTREKRHMVVLSDGIQNVPPMVEDAGDVDADGAREHAVAGSLLQDFGIPMHTLSIGAAPGTAHEQLLAAIADETNGLHQHTCAPQEELEGFLINSLVEALQGDTVELVGYETGSLAADAASAEHRFPLNESTRRAVFMLSWSGGAGQDLELGVFTPEGDAVRLESLHTRGPSLHRVVLDFPLFLPDRSTPAAFVGEWRAVVSRRSASTHPLPYRVYVLADETAIEVDFAFERSLVEAGEPIALRVAAKEGIRPLSLDAIDVTVERPRAWLGDLIRRAEVSDERRRQIRFEGPSDVARSPLMQTYAAISREPRYATLLRPVEERVKLFDDGRLEHGDARANDGIWSALYPNTKTPGEYRFRFGVVGRSQLGRLRREKTASATVRVGRPVGTEVESSVLRRVGRGGTFSLRITPRDRFGNYLGPGYGDAIQVDVIGAAVLGPVEDLLDGSYRQPFRAKNLASVRTGTLSIRGDRVELPAADLPGHCRDSPAVLRRICELFRR